LRLQLTCKAGVRKNREHGSTMLMFTFHLGPLEIFCLAHLPRDGESESDVYVKVALKGRTLVDAGTSEVENWTSTEGEPSASASATLEGGDRERVALGPLLVVVEDGVSVLKLRKRSLIDPKYKSFEEWRSVK
jgi:hypothetical protein